MRTLRDISGIARLRNAVSRPGPILHCALILSACIVPALAGQAGAGKASPLTIGQISPTVFFVRENDELLQVAKVKVSNTGPASLQLATSE